MSFKKLLFVFLLSICPLISNAVNHNYINIDNKINAIFQKNVTQNNHGLKNGENGKDGKNGTLGGNGGNGGS